MSEKVKITATRTRFAPSPTGDPQLGNMRTALFTYLFAKHLHGVFMLRIEDTDKAREVPGSIERIEDSLRWLGLAWDEGPILQSSRLALYKKAAIALVEQSHAYYCFCSPERLDQVRKDQQAKGLPSMYDKHCRKIETKQANERAQKESHVIRLKVPEKGDTAVPDFLRGTVIFHNSTIDDQVLLKSDGYPTYHLAVVVDDHDLQISHVIRGEDWLPSAPKHVLLYQFFGWDLPVFVHLPLIVGTDKRKLSKRLGDMSLLAYKDQGYSVEAVINFLARLGFSPPDDRKLYSLTELAEVFSLERVHLNPAVFDIDKLQWFDRLAKEKNPTGTTLYKETIELLQHHGIVGNPPTETQDYFITEAIKRVEDTKHLEAALAYLWQDKVILPVADLNTTITADQRLDTLTKVRQVLENVAIWEEAPLGNALRELAKNQPLKSKDFFQLLIGAVTGSISAPPLFASLALLGKEKTLKRLKEAEAGLMRRED